MLFFDSIIICIEIEEDFFQGKMYRYLATNFFAIGLMEINSCVPRSMVFASGADASISPMARRTVCRVTNQNTATGNTLKQQHAQKDGRLILTILTR